MRGGGGGSPRTGKARLCAGFRPASPGPSPPPSSRLSAAGRRGGKAQAERARGRLSSDPFWRDLGLRPLSGSAGTAREAGGAVRPRKGSGARRGQRVTRLRPGPGPGDALCSGRASLRIVGRGRLPECAREAGALWPPNRARSPSSDPPGTFSARPGQGPALPGMRDCARRRRGLRDPSAHAPVSGPRGVVGAGATGQGSAGKSRGLGTSPRRCARCPGRLRAARQGCRNHPRGSGCPGSWVPTPLLGCASYPGADSPG